MMTRRLAPAALMILAACSSNSPPPKATLADLPAFDVTNYQAAPQVGAAQLSVLYQQILALEPGPQTRQQIRYRLSQMQTEHVQTTELADGAEREQLLQLIEQYQALLRDYPDDLNNELIRYQLARSYDLLGESALSLTQLNALISRYPDSEFAAEVWFRKADIHYSQLDFANALVAYQQVLAHKSVKLHQHALYMAGWCEFKLGQYANADRMFLQALDLTEPQYQHTRLAGDDEMDVKQQRLRQELLQILSVSLSYQQQALSLQQLIDNTPYRDGRVSSRPMPQIAELYQALADFLASKQLFAASFDSYRTLVKAYPQEVEAASFQLTLITKLLERGEADMALAEQRQFILQFGPSSDYWRFGRPAQLTKVRQPLLHYLQYFASNAYHQAQQQAPKRADLFRQAASDYDAMVQVLQQLPEREAPSTALYNVADLQFLTAEALAQANEPQQAIARYQQLAYGPVATPAPTLYQAADAAYRQVEVATAAGVDDTALIGIQQAFYQQFPAHPQAMAVALSRLQQQFNAKQADAALSLAGTLLHWPVAVSAAQQPLQRQALYLQSQLQLQREAYADAEQSLQQLLDLPATPGIDRQQLASQLASAVYQQAQQPAPVAQQRALLAKLLQQPRSSFHEAAAWQQLELADAAEVPALLRQFIIDHPTSQRRLTAQAKLVALEEAAHHYAAASTIYQQMAAQSQDPALQREALWNAATTATKANQAAQAFAIWQDYVSRFAAPHAPAQEARFLQLSLLAANPNLQTVAPRGSKKPAAKSLDETIAAQILKAEQQAGAASTPRTRFIAASAALSSANRLAKQSAEVVLVHPLKQSLGKKRSLMTSAIALYEEAIRLGDRSVLTAANYHIADLYRTLAKDLLASQRPAGLDELALEQYNLLLEEQAYPFEEQAIAIYEKNLALLTHDYVDDYVRQSLQRLAELVPAKYQRPDDLPEVLHVNP